jgi:hypothetical protein
MRRSERIDSEGKIHLVMLAESAKSRSVQLCLCQAGRKVASNLQASLRVVGNLQESPLPSSLGQMIGTCARHYDSSSIRTTSSEFF